MSSDWAPAIAVSIIALSVSASFVLRGPVGKALAQWIGGWSHTEARWIEAKSRAEGAGAGAADVEQLRQEVDDLRGQVVEVQERLDFTERLLAQSRAADRIGSAGK
jgi:hypothetical protein